MNEKDTSNKAIIRVAKIKNFNDLYRYQNHANREIDTPNANTELSHENFIMRGSNDVVHIVKDFMSEHNLKIDGQGTKNQSVLCTEMLITASPDFFKDKDGNIDKNLVERWAYENDKWLKEQYGDNYLFSKVHLDETTPHISIIIQPTKYHCRYKREVLAHKSWFGKDVGKKYNKLRDLQENYPKAMQEAGFDLGRGVEKSKAKHQDVKTFYGKVNNVKEAVTEAVAEVVQSNKSLLQDLHHKLENERKEKERILATAKEEVDKRNTEIKARDKVLERLGEHYNIKDDIEKAIPIAKKKIESKKDINNNKEKSLDID
ncbi:MobV family relaxase [Clostridium perfringens]|nr:MobV family relaxase [Clostridium perfringens]